MEVAHDPMLITLGDLHNPQFGHRLSKPGAYLEKLSSETREHLKNLKSEDIANVRAMPWWF
jgi:hypothetical protein